jgi:orotate phosphoribosyltransferase-like protein
VSFDITCNLSENNHRNKGGSASGTNRARSKDKSRCSIVGDIVTSGTGLCQESHQRESKKTRSLMTDAE